MASDLYTFTDLAIDLLAALGLGLLLAACGVLVMAALVKAGVLPKGDR